MDDDVTHEMSFRELPECTKECICELAARRELGASAEPRARLHRATEIMAERERINAVYTIHGVEFVDYDERLYQALVASGASNGRVEVDDEKLGPL